jgi:eukaryotic-like serine/threonine-protein kinase
MDLDLLKKAIKDNNPGRVAKLASGLFSDSMQKENFIFASEMLMLKGLSLAAEKHYDEAEKTFLTVFDKLKNRTSLFHNIRGKIFFARFMLKKGDLNSSKKLCEEISSGGSVFSDPILRFDFFLLKTEIIAYEHFNIEKKTLHLIKCLEEYIESSLILSFIYQDNSIQKVLGKYDPFTLLLDLFLEAGNTEKVLYYINLLLHLDTCIWANLNNFPWKNITDEYCQTLQTEEKNLGKAIEEYSQVLTSLNMNFLKILENPSEPAKDNIQIYSDEQLFQKGARLISAYRKYTEEIENICGLSPDNSSLRGKSPVNLTKLQLLIDRESAVITYARTTDAWFAVLITFSNIKCFKLGMTRDESRWLVSSLQGLIKKLDYPFDPNERTFEKEIFAALQTVNRRLFEPLQPYLEGIKKLYVSSDSYQVFIPMSFLWDGLNFTADKYEITQFSDNQSIFRYLKKVESGFIPQALKLLEISRKLELLRNSTKPRQETMSEENDTSSISANCCRHITINDISDTDKILETQVITDTGQSIKLGDLVHFRVPPPVAFISLKNVLVAGESIEQLAGKIKKLQLTLSFFGIECSLLTCENLQYTKENISAENPSSSRLQEKQPFKNGIIFGNLLFPQAGRFEDELLFSPIRVLYSGKKPILTPPVFSENMIYFGGEDTYLYAIDTNTEMISWKYKNGDWVSIPPILDENVLYTGSMDKYLRALFITDGKKKWEFDLAGWPVGGPFVRREGVYILNRENVLYLLDKNQGKVIKSKKLEDRLCHFMRISEDIIILYTYGGRLLTLTTKELQNIWDKEISSRKLTAGDVHWDSLLFGDEEGKLYSVNFSEKRKKWERDVKRKLMYIWTKDKKIAVALYKHGYLMGINPQDGNTIWEFSHVSQDLQTIAVEASLVWIQTEDRKIAALDKYSGKLVKILTKLPTTIKFMSHYDDSLYMIDNENQVIKIPLINTENNKTYLRPEEKSALPVKIPDVTLLNHRLLGVIEKAKEKTKEKNIETRITEENRTAKEQILPVEKNTYVTEANITTPLQVLKDVVAAGTRDFKLIGLDKDSMKILWKTDIEGSLEHQPAIFNYNFLVTDKQGMFYVIDPENGSIKWSKHICLSFTSPPCVVQGNLYIGGNEGRFFCVSVFNGNIRWSIRLGQNITTTPIFHEQHIYITGDNGEIVKLNVSGEIVWTCHTHDIIKIDMGIEGDYLIAMGSRGCIYAVHLKTGSIYWKHYCAQRGFAGPPVITGKRVYVGMRTGEILMLHLKTGTLINKIPLEEQISTPLVKYYNFLLTGTPAGNILCWNERTMETEVLFQIKSPLQLPILIEQDYLYFVEGFSFIRRYSLEKLAEQAKADMIAQEVDIVDTLSDSIQTTQENVEQTEDVEENILKDEEKAETIDKKTEVKKSLEKYGEKKNNSGRSDMPLFNVFLYMLPMIALLLLFLVNVIEFKSFLFFSLLVLGFDSLLIFSGYLKFQNERLHGLMNRFVPSGLVQNMNGNKSPNVEKDVTILFQDLFNYTSISEILAPTELYELLNEIDKITNEIVTKNGGEIMSYVGDAQMIAFNASKETPHHALKAVKTAIEINRKVKALGEKLEKDLNKEFPFKLLMGFGINTGPALVGLRGGSNRMEPFVIGDTTNTAVRIQKETRRLDHHILITQETCDRIGSYYRVRDLGDFQLKGKKESTRIYSLILE